jgi:hypothetical protein
MAPNDSAGDDNSKQVLVLIQTYLLNEECQARSERIHGDFIIFLAVLF